MVCQEELEIDPDGYNKFFFVFSISFMKGDENLFYRSSLLSNLQGFLKNGQNPVEWEPEFFHSFESAEGLHSQGESLRCK